MNMSKPENEKLKGQTMIEDLPVDPAQQDEVKGGRTGTANGGVWKTTDGGAS